MSFVVMIAMGQNCCIIPRHIRILRCYSVLEQTKPRVLPNISRSPHCSPRFGLNWYFAFEGSNMSDLVKHITDAEFQATVASGVVLVDFWAPWCGPCKTIAPFLDELAGEYGDRVQIVKINIDENQKVATEYAVASIPLLLLFKGGQKIAQRVGGAGKAALKEFIDQAF